jgi:hypothetical protein
VSRTTKDMIAEVRSILDEVNEAQLDDQADLVPSLNRGYDYAIRLLSSHYVAPILASEIVTLSSSTQEYPIPEDAFEDRLLKVEVYNNQSYVEVIRLDYKDISSYDIPTKQNVPYYYTIVGRNYRLVPPPTATYPLRIWYAKHPGPLVEEQGSISVIGTNYVIVDEAGPGLSSTGVNAYVNIVDGATGLIKATLQIQSILGNRIAFKTTPDRTTIYGREVVGVLPTTIEKDDLICSAEGSAIPVLRSTVTNFLVQFVVAEMTRKLGGEPSIEEKVKQDFEQQVKNTWAGRERYTRVKKRAREWGATGRRYWTNT